MNAQSAKTPTLSESVTITLTPDDRYLLLGIIEAVTERLFSAVSSSDTDWLEPFVPVSSTFNKIRNLNFKLQDSVFKSGDACLHSAQSSDAVGQGDSIICHHCDGDGTYTKPSFLKLFQCEICRGTGLRSVDSVGHGGNQ